MFFKYKNYDLGGGGSFAKGLLDPLRFIVYIGDLEEIMREAGWVGILVGLDVATDILLLATAEDIVLLATHRRNLTLSIHTVT